MFKNMVSVFNKKTSRFQILLALTIELKKKKKKKKKKK